MDDDDNTPIEDLCKPISATVMPKSALFGGMHEERDARTAQSRDRMSQAEIWNRRLARMHAAKKEKNND